MVERIARAVFRCVWASPTLGLQGFPLGLRGVPDGNPLRSVPNSLNDNSDLALPLMATFTVDTHLFRELGELLVGRDSTALIELIKNSYDADAVQVVVYGENLGEEGSGLIRITDDGVGMSPDQFQEGFLRVASRSKETPERRSLRYGRRFTGEKGIGRLAAHKLSRQLAITSIPWDQESGGLRTGIEAKIDWDEVEAKATLDDLEGSGAVLVKLLPASQERSAGTVITLSRLRRAWGKRQHARFLEEVQTFDPPSILVDPLPRAVLTEPLLFKAPVVRDVHRREGTHGPKDPGFRVRLEGDLAPPEDYWKAAVAASDWIIEIDARSDPRTVRYGIAPSERTRRELQDAERKVFEIVHPDPVSGPFFTARLLLRTGPQKGSGEKRMWATRNSGVRVFMEGFRVLPYGESGNDWLGLDRDYVRRGRGGILGSFPEPFEDPSDDTGEKPGLLHLPQKSYFGAVFLTHEGAESLRLLVNREGFVPGGTYERLVDLVRGGIDLTTRVRAAATKRERAERKERRKIKSRSDGSSAGSLAPDLISAAEKARTLASEATELSKGGDHLRATDKLNEAVELVEELSGASQDLASEAAMLRVLASVGTQLAGFIHEINSLLGAAEGIESSLDELRKSDAVNRELGRSLSQLHRGAADLRRHLERQASYLVDIVTPDARRRRSRQRIGERFESARRLVAHLADSRDIRVVNEIPESLRSPPMFPAELTAAFANLLTNAVKAAGHGGKIWAGGESLSDGTIRLFVANTGVSVPVEEGERWFAPFESSTTTVDPVLGQGMGLGLPITRSMLEEYGAEIRFVEPPPGYSASVEIRFPGE